MEILQDYFVFLIPLAVIQGGLLIASLVHIFRHKTYARGNRVLWVLVSLIGIIGPVLYFTLGRGEE